MKKIMFLLGISLLAVNLMFTSCKKDNTNSTTTTEVTDAQDNSIAAASYDDVDAEVDDATSNVKAALLSDDPAPVNKVVSWKKGIITRDLIFNNINRNGKVKSGKIIVTITYPTSGDSTNENLWVKTITFDNYTVGGRRLEGTKTITYKGKVDGTHPEWEVKLDSGKITFKNGKFITLQYTRTRTMIEGESTPLIRADNVYEFNGSGSGVNRRGVAFTTTTTNLVKAANCPFFKSGSVSYVSANKSITITYNGGDTCEPNATIDVNGKVTTIDPDSESN